MYVRSLSGEGGKTGIFKRKFRGDDLFLNFCTFLVGGLRDTGCGGLKLRIGIVRMLRLLG